MHNNSKFFYNTISKLRQSQYLVYAYIIFLAGFYVSPNTHLHRNFFYLFVLLPFFVSVDLKNIFKYARSTVFISSFVFLTYFLISIEWTAHSVSGKEIYDILRNFFMLISFILLTISISLSSNLFFSKLKFWLCLTGSLAAIIFTIVFYTAHNFPQERVFGPFNYMANPNSAAMFFGILAILSYQSALSEKKNCRRIFFWTSFFVLSLFILFTQSRGPLLAYFFCLVLGLAFEQHWKMILVFVSFCIGLLLLVEFGDTGITGFFNRGIGNRQDLWLATLSRISDAPIFGEGYFTDIKVWDGRWKQTPHNLFLLVTLQSGLIGGSLLGVLFLVSLKQSYRFFKASGNWTFFCLNIFFFLCMAVDSVYLLYRPSLGWMIFWLPISLIAAEEVRSHQF